MCVWRGGVGDGGMAGELGFVGLCIENSLNEVNGIKWYPVSKRGGARDGSSYSGVEHCNFFKTLVSEYTRYQYFLNIHTRFLTGSIDSNSPL